ncbi:somatostatin-1 [Clarias gariepinus]
MCSQMQIVVLVVFLVLVSGVRAAPRYDLLDHMLQNKGNEEDLLLKLLSELEIPDENDNLSDNDMELNRILRHLPITQRERKAGCRNFFWKTFTSC